MLKSALVWTNPKGRELIRVLEGGDDATIIPMTCNEADLRELAKAANEAADQIRAFREDRNGKAD